MTESPRYTLESAPELAPIALAPPNIGEDERRRAYEALAEQTIVGGPLVAEFEREVARCCGDRIAVATASGTAALHLALIAAGVGPGDAVLMPALTFVAPANAIRYTGATPLMVDVEPTYRQLDVDLLATWLSEECEQRDDGLHTRGDEPLRVAAVLPVDLLGHPVDVEALQAVLDVYDKGPRIVEDAAEAFGATAHDRPIGTTAELACLSFNANKIVTAGGGGMVLCDDETLASRIRCLTNQAREGDGWRHSEVGFNYKLACANAALGLGQLERLDEFVAAKRANADRYREALDGLPGVGLPEEASWAQSTYWLYAIEVDHRELGLSVGDLADELERHGIESRPMFTPLHLTGAHAGSAATPCPVAERIGAEGLALPSSTALDGDDVARVAAAIHAACRAAR